MTAATLTREDTQTDTQTGEPKVSHYVNRHSIVDAVVFGNALEALCGYIFTPHNDVKGLPVCEACKAIYDTDAVSVAHGRLVGT